MRINGCVLETYTNRLAKNNKTEGKLMEKLTSGKRINRASDDAAGTSICESLKAQVRGLSQAERNVQDGISMLQVSDGALGEITDNIHRMKELAIQSSNGTLTQEDRALVDGEFQQVKKGIEEITKNTQFNGIKVIDGERNLDIQIKAVPFTAYRIVTFDANLSNLGIDTLNVQDTTNAQASVKNISDALQKISEGRSKLGADLNSLQHTYDDNTSANLNLTSSLSRIEDIDVANAYMGFVRGQIVSQYSEAMSSSANQDVKRVGSLIN